MSRDYAGLLEPRVMDDIIVLDPDLPGGHLRSLGPGFIPQPNEGRTPSSAEKPFSRCQEQSKGPMEPASWITVG